MKVANAVAEILKREARGHDLILTSGGVSTGDADYVKDAIERVGSLVFWRMAIKPGRPVAMGVIAGAPFVGLPGNPVASFVTFVHLVRPLIDRLSGAEPRRIAPTPVRAAFHHRKRAGRREYLRASLRPAADGTTPVNARVLAFSNTQQLRIDGTKLINTGNIPAHDGYTAGLEFAAQKGPFIVQSEYDALGVSRARRFSRSSLLSTAAESSWLSTSSAPSIGSFIADDFARRR